MVGLSMFSLTRSTAKRAPRDLIRSLSVAISTEIQQPQSPPPTGKAGPSHGRSRIAKRAHELPPLSNTKVPVPDDHGLYAFFRQKTGSKDTGEAAYEVVETPDQGQLSTGRAWEAAELRNKSFKDLHTLWYVVLRERNLLATQKEEARRMGVVNTSLQVPMDRIRNCRKTMSRIKAVLNERRLAYEGAFQIAQQEADNAKLELDRKLERLADPTEQKKVQMWKNRDRNSNKKMRTTQTKVSKGGRPSRHDGEDHRILRIQRPNIQTSKSKIPSRELEEDSAPEPPLKKPANPWVTHRAYGNYRAPQIGAGEPGQNQKQAGRRRGVPKPRPVRVKN